MGLLFYVHTSMQGCSATQKRRGNAFKKLAILKQLPAHFKAKLAKGVGTPFHAFPPSYTPASMYSIKHQSTLMCVL